LAVLVRHLASPILILLTGTAAVSFALGQRTEAVIIGLILAASVGLGFANDYRSERAVDALHSRVSHLATVVRDGAPVRVDVPDLVPGDVIRLALGQVVPADVRVLSATNLQCDEAILTGESLPVPKNPEPVRGAAGAIAACVAFMGTVVHAGDGSAVVVATAGDAQFGRIAQRLGERPADTTFQIGLRQFSALLLRVGLVLTGAVAVVSLALQRPVVESLLFSLSIAIGITPQLLPAIVSTSLAFGSRRLAERKVLVKRLVSIEDLGDIDLLVTDKTGTLTDGRLTFTDALDPAGSPSPGVLRLGVLASRGQGGAGGVAGAGSALDDALLSSPKAHNLPLTGFVHVATAPFDHDRLLMSVLVRDPAGSPQLIVKGAPEALLKRCVDRGARGTAALQRLFASGARVIAIGRREWSGGDSIGPEDERGLTLVGFLTFADEPKAHAAEALRRLALLGVTVKICTGDNGVVAEKVCRDLGLESSGTVTGEQLAALAGEDLSEACEHATIFARVSPEQKAQIVRVLRSSHAVGFLGDGVNDALGLHAADIGISVDSGADVAKDAADVVLLEQELAVLAEGVEEGRRIFANTIKYVRMGTSSNFGNMCSAAVASAVLPFLPLLPAQVLLNNLLYDLSQLGIPTDRVDDAEIARPTRWDIRSVRRFMVVFGPLSSAMDFLTFALLLYVFDVGPQLFRAAWFTESLATQTLVVFAIRTTGSILRGRPSPALVVGVGLAATAGVVLPLCPLADPLGFEPPSLLLLAALGGVTVAYLAFVEAVKRRVMPAIEPAATRVSDHERRIRRRAARFSVGKERRIGTFGNGAIRG
jgi:Mg2+-importing ATPase